MFLELRNFRKIQPGGWPTPLKNMKVNWDHYSQYGYGSIPIDTFLVGWTSIYQLFWGSLGTRVLTHPHIWKYKSHVQTTNQHIISSLRSCSQHQTKLLGVSDSRPYIWCTNFPPKPRCFPKITIPGKQDLWTSSHVAIKCHQSISCGVSKEKTLKKYVQLLTLW